MNTDKAYILGLIIGGGVWGNAEDVFKIRLPYRKWGDYEQNPKRAGQITRDIMQVVSPMFRNIYEISVSFEAQNSFWNILCEGNLLELQKDLISYGIVCEGELRQNSNLKSITPLLLDNNLKRRFIAGLADTIGSMAKSHRRFSDEIQTLSFEIKGFNFEFVCDLCKLLYSINCYPDQILWNHPNFHCANDPYYSKWVKGFKLRVQLDQYAQFGAFAFKTKAESSIANRSLQQETHEAIPCPERELHITPSCLHPAEDDVRLPDTIRGGHFLHNRHVCAVLGCEHAPYDRISDAMKNSGKLINPFPILHKGSLQDVTNILENTVLFSSRTYDNKTYKVSEILRLYKENTKELLFGSNNYNGYPVNEIIKGVAYLIADEHELNGKRIKGNFLDLINKKIVSNEDCEVIFSIPDLLTPLFIHKDNKAILIGPMNPCVYKNLVEVSKDNKYKLLTRKITEEDLKND